MKIALAFPDMTRHGFADFSRQLRASAQDVDLLMLPEGFERVALVRTDWPVTRDALGRNGKVAALLKRYQALADSTDTAITGGVAFSAGAGSDKVSINGVELDQWAFVVRPGKQPIWYHKHTTSAHTAPGDEGWSPDRDLPVFTHKGKSIGLSICHDMYLSPIPRALKQKGAEIWVNLSYQNVRPHMWTRMLRARSVENDMISLCTLHRNPEESNPQNMVFGQSPKGKITLRRAEDGAALDEIDRADRTGALYLCDTDRLEVTPSTDDLSEPQQDPRITGRISAAGKAAGDKRDYQSIPLRLSSFINQPERIWAALDKLEAGKTPALEIKAASQAQYDRMKPLLMKVIGARGIEFGTLITVSAPDTSAQRDRLQLAAWRSSNYKDVRICEAPTKGPLPFDERFLFGPDGTAELLSDTRGTIDPLPQLVQAASGKRGKAAALSKAPKAPTASR